MATIGAFKGDTRSSDYDSCRILKLVWFWAIILCRVIAIFVKFLWACGFYYSSYF